MNDKKLGGEFRYYIKCIEVVEAKQEVCRKKCV